MAKIVFCEDSDLLCRLIQIALRNTRHEIHLANDGFQGLALIERIRPDLVFTDIYMPGCDGLQLNAILKSRPEFAHLPVILMTGAAPEEARAEAQRHGMAGYLPKPFMVADLRDKVEEFTRDLRADRPE